MSLSYAIKEYNFIGPGFNKFGILKLEKVSDLNVGKAMDLVKFIDWYLSPENLSMDGELHWASIKSRKAKLIKALQTLKNKGSHVPKHLMSQENIVIKGPVEIKANAPNPRMFVGACDEFLNIKVVKTQPINHAFRMFDTDTTKEEYNSLKESIVRDGLREPVKVFRANDGEIYVLGGNTRTKILKESACLEVPVLWRNDLDGKDPWDKELLRANFEDNLRVESTDSNKFQTAEGVFNRNPDMTRADKKQYCKYLRFSLEMYEEYGKLKYGYSSEKWGWIEPRPLLVKELEEGKAGKSITGQRKSQMLDHKRMLSLETHKQPENAELNEILEQIDPVQMVWSIKEYYEKLRAVTSTNYSSKIFENCDKQHIGGTIHYISAMILAEEINNRSDKFTAEASEGSAHYDVYVRDKFDDIVATIEVKTTQDKNWSSAKEKVGYHMLVSHSKELNFFVNICYLDAGAWEGAPAFGFTLKPKNVGKFINAGAWNFTYCGEIFEDGGDFIIQRHRIQVDSKTSWCYYSGIVRNKGVT